MEEEAVCQFCKKQPDWKIEDLVEDKKYWSCQKHLGKVVPQSAVIKLTWRKPMIKEQSILSPVSTVNTTSKAHQGAAREPENWQQLGTASVQEALSKNPQKVNVDPAELK